MVLVEHVGSWWETQGVREAYSHLLSLLSHPTPSSVSSAPGRALPPPTWGQRPILFLAKPPGHLTTIHCVSQRRPLRRVQPGVCTETMFKVGRQS